MNIGIFNQESNHGNPPEAGAALAAVREQKEQEAIEFRQEKAKHMAQLAIDGTVRPSDAQLAGQLAAEKQTPVHQIPIEDLSAKPTEIPIEVK